MPVRYAAGTGEIDYAYGASNITGAITMASFFRPDTVTGEHELFEALNASNEPKHWGTFTTGNQVAVYNGSTVQVGPVGVTQLIPGNASLIVMTKASGNVKPIWYGYHWAANEEEEFGWFKAEGPATLANASSVASGSMKNFYGLGGGEGKGTHFNGEFFAHARWNKVLNETQVKSLIESTIYGAWKALEPVGLWLFHQNSVSHPVKDLSGNGADQTKIVGTEVLAKEPPIPWGIEDTEGAGGGSRMLRGLG